MKQTAMQLLLDEIEQSIGLKNNPVMTDDRKIVLMALKVFIADEQLIEKEKQQIIEAALNFTSSKEDAQIYYEITYGR